MFYPLNANFCPLAYLAVDASRSLNGCRTLVNNTQSKVSSQYLTLIKPATIIVDHKPDTIVAKFQINGDLCRFGMFHDVVKRLLCDTVEGNLNVSRYFLFTSDSQCNAARC